MAEILVHPGIPAADLSRARGESLQITGFEHVICNLISFVPQYVYHRSYRYRSEHSSGERVGFSWRRKGHLTTRVLLLTIYYTSSLAYPF